MSRGNAEVSNRLDPGKAIVPGQYLESQNGIYRLGFGVHQDLVIHKEFPHHAGHDLWSPAGNFPVAKCVMEETGNLVCYDQANHPICVSGTYGNPGSWAVMADNGELVVCRKDGTRVWCSPTVQADSGPRAVLRDPITDTLLAGEMLIEGDALHSKNGQYELILQGDGNLVLYRGSRDPKDALWSSGTYGKDVVSAIMQFDGVLVLYDDNGKVVWASGKEHHPGACLVVRDDGTLVIYDVRHQTAVWTQGKKG